jgi:hypothetical protein
LLVLKGLLRLSRLIGEKKMLPKQNCNSFSVQNLLGPFTVALELEWQIKKGRCCVVFVDSAKGAS